MCFSSLVEHKNNVIDFVPFPKIKWMRWVLWNCNCVLEIAHCKEDQIWQANIVEQSNILTKISLWYSDSFNQVLVNMILFVTFYWYYFSILKCISTCHQNYCTVMVQTLCFSFKRKKSQPTWRRWKHTSHFSCCCQ